MEDTGIHGQCNANKGQELVERVVVVGGRGEEEWQWLGFCLLSHLTMKLNGFASDQACEQQ
jgi:hypothetical protein